MLPLWLLRVIIINALPLLFYRDEYAIME